MVAGAAVKGATKLASKVVPDLLGAASQITKNGWDYAIKAGKLTSKEADNILRKGDIEAFDNFSVLGGQLSDQAQRNSTVGQFADAGQKAIPERQTYQQWKAGAQTHYDEQWAAGNRMDPMRGYPHFTDIMQENPTSLKADRPGIRSYRATPGSTRDAAGNKKLTFIDKDFKKKGTGARTKTEEVWVEELQKGLKEYGVDEAEAEEMINTMKRANKLQDQERTLRNNARKKRNPKLKNEQLLTIEHIGALKNGWPNIPENRWGLITKKANSKAGARLDPADISIRMQGTPGKGKHGTWVDEKVRKFLLDKDLGGDNWDPTRNLPEKIKRKILAAKPTKDDTLEEVIDDILTEFYTDGS